MPELMHSPFDFFDRFLVLTKESRVLVDSTIDLIGAAKGEILIKEGQTSPYMYITRKGIARGFAFEDGEDKTFTLWAENYAFGDITNYITNYPPIKSYELLEDSELYRLDITRFRELFSLNIELATLGRILIEKHIVNQELTRRLYINKDSSERFEVFLREKPGFIHRVKFKYIASFLGMRPETFTRLHTRWVKNNYIP
jgi:CRP-like cAMP-binding protein